MKFLKKNIYEVCTYSQYNNQLIDVNIKNIDEISDFTNENVFVGITAKNDKEELKFRISEEVIELLIEPLYKQQDKMKVVVRELLQNALDGCKKIQSNINHDIEIKYLKEERGDFLNVIDNGIGMNLVEIQENYLTVGKSNKKDSQEGLVGKYGIGALSMFLVGDTVEVKTKKVNEPELHFELFIKDGKKQVSMLEHMLELNSCISYTAIKIQLNSNLHIASLDEFITKIGLDNYITNPNNQIKITYGDKSKVIKNIADKMKWFTPIKENMYLIDDNIMEESSQTSEEDKQFKSIFKRKNVIFYNDMISNVTYNTDIS